MSYPARTPFALTFMLATALALPVIAEQSDLPPGLRSAQFLPGWTASSGARILALELVLEPGWKTYWRSPGDSGLPPQLDWQGSENLSHVTLHWPAPQIIQSGESLEMGYYDRLVLPMTVYSTDPDIPVQISAQIDVGLCDNICVPVHLQLQAPLAGAGTDPVIAQAMMDEPQRLDILPACDVTPIEDGLRVTIALPDSPVRLAAIELANSPQVWVSAAEIVTDDIGQQAVVDMVGPSGAPFDLDRDGLRLTVIPSDGSRATDTIGCAPV